MTFGTRILSVIALTLGLATLASAPAARAEEASPRPAAQVDAVQKHGAAYVIYLPGDLNYYEVVDRLKTEIMAQNWEIVSVSDIDLGMRKYGLFMFNKLVLACKSQYLAQAIREDPYISLLIPCRFTVFQEIPSAKQGAEPQPPGRIVIGFADPVAEAEAVGIKQHKAAEMAAGELKNVLEAVADYYKR
jgi:uncharacterized protein (DUF302 family)